MYIYTFPDQDFQGFWGSNKQVESHDRLSPEGNANYPERGSWGWIIADRHGVRCSVNQEIHSTNMTNKR